ncbi:MAG: hypothetical protein KDA41_15200, partial [Planctomycetales bacterium]|nr:hypothetical protein [Planctomycetales bacterium]
MRRLLILLYGLLCYAVGMGGLVYFILFVGGWDFLPLHIDSRSPGDAPTALLINAGLMLLLTLQHSAMARPRFKQAWTKVIPAAAERGTYVLFSGVVFLLICLFWQAMPGTVWRAESPIARGALTAVQLLGWLFVVVASFAINHF